MHACIYFIQICYFYILNIFIYNRNYMNKIIEMYIDVNISKYILCVYYLYIHNKYTQHTHIYYANTNLYFVRD